MSVYKQINPQDIYQDNVVSNKQWLFTYNTSSYDEYIKCYSGICTSSLFVSGTAIGIEQLEYNKINQLFYHKYNDVNLNNYIDSINSLYYISASNIRNTNSYFIYNENPLFETYFPTNENQTIKSIYVNKSIYGNQILPQSFIISSSDYYILDDGYGNLKDFKYILSGALYVSSSYVDYNYIKEYSSGSGIDVGNIFYTFGLSVITNPLYQNLFPLPTTGSISYSFKNEWNIYENYIYCKIKSEHFNLSYNPTLLKPNGSEGEILDFATGSFSPYMTSIGLYNDNNELLAVAKIGQPIYISPEIDMNIIIKYDT